MSSRAVPARILDTVDSFYSSSIFAPGFLVCFHFPQELGLCRSQFHTRFLRIKKSWLRSLHDLSLNQTIIEPAQLPLAFLFSPGLYQQCMVTTKSTISNNCLATVLLSYKIAIAKIVSNFLISMPFFKFILI